MWELNHKEGWVLNNWPFWTVILQNTFESPLDCRKIKPINPKGNQSWIFIGRTDAETEAPILWSPSVKSWLIGKDSDARRDWGQEEKGTTEDEMAGWHHWLNGRESEWTPGVGDGQGGLACFNSWGHKESDTTERLNWTELILFQIISPFRLLHNIEQSSLCHTVSPCWLFIVNIAVCTWPSPNSLTILSPSFFPQQILC